jgi:hypothetical protein
MTRATANRLYNTFVKGLITEASPLTYTENASYDEDNCIIFRKGNRVRRLGVDFETDYSLSPHTMPATNVVTQEFRWDIVAERNDTTFLVHQVGKTLYFYDMNVTPLSNGLKTFTVNLDSFIAPNQTNVELTEVSLAFGKGLLFVVGPRIEPFYVEYLPDSDSITTNRIYVQIRDFQGLNDSLANDEEPSTLSNEHRYNLKNQGWNTPENDGSGSSAQYFDSFGAIASYNIAGDEPITTYFGAISRYPGNNKQWFVGKDGTGVFTPTLLNKTSFGNGRSPRGHFVVDAFYTDYSAISGVPSLPVEVTKERPNSVAFYSGRTWYACNSTIYYSQILDSKGKAGFCYQEADPTSEDISDLIASDGGVVPIPDSGKIIKIAASGGGLVVFATNGLWYITGTASGFSALDITINKISSVGVDSAGSIVDVNGNLFWWSKIGIQGMSQKTGLFGAIEGAFDKQNITEDTIQTFYNQRINDNVKLTVKGQYDPATNTVQWLYRSDETIPAYFYDRVLIYDMTLAAFYPWSFNCENRPYITGLFLTPQINQLENDTQIRESFFKYITAVPQGVDYKFTFSLMENTDFTDWEKFDGTGVAYLSFVETGYELLQDAMRKKQALYVIPVFRKTEQTYVETPEGDFIADKPSSCYFQVKWDWASSSLSNKWSTKREAYRITRMPAFTESDLTFDTGFPVVITKQKVRGSGRAIQFRFESNAIGADFDLLGWSVAYSGNTQP